MYGNSLKYLFMKFIKWATLVNL